MKKDEARLGKGLGAIFGEDLSNVIEEIQQGDRPKPRQEAAAPAGDDRSWMRKYIQQRDKGV